MTYFSFSPDSKLLAVSSGRKITFWNTNGTLLKTINKSSDGNSDFTDVSFSPNGKKIALVSINTVEIIALDGREIKTLEGSLNGGNMSGSVSFSPDSKLLAAATGGNSVKLWNLENEESKTFMGFNGYANVSFSADGKMLATVDSETAKLWSLDGQKSTILKGDKDSLISISISISPNSKIIGIDGKTLATVDGEAVKLWSLDGQAKNVKEDKDFVKSISISPDGKMIATGYYDGTVKLWNRNGILLKKLTGHTGYFTALSFSPNGRILASASYDGTVKLWSTNGTLLKTFNNDTVLKAFSNHKIFGNDKALVNDLIGENKGRKVPVNDLSFSPDSKIFASANDDGTIKLWSIDGKEIKTLKGNNDGRVSSVSFSPDGKRLISAADSAVQIWSHEGILLKTFDLKFGSSVKSVRFSPDGNTIALVSWENIVKILDTDGKELKIFKGHNDWVNSVNFSPDGQSIVSGSADGTAKFWSINGRELKTFKTDIVTLSPDAKILALGSEDGTVIIKSLDIDELLNLGCNWLHGYLKNSSEASENDKRLCDGVATGK